MLCLTRLYAKRRICAHRIHDLAFTYSYFLAFLEMTKKEKDLFEEIEKLRRENETLRQTQSEGWCQHIGVMENTCVAKVGQHWLMPSF